MTIQECYDQLHGDLKDACSRLLNETMVTKFVLKFPSDPSMEQLREAVKAKDIEVSFRAVHTLKGVAANLSFTQLFHSAVDLTEQLRPRQEQADPELLEALEEEYKRTLDILAEFAESNA